MIITITINLWYIIGFLAVILFGFLCVFLPITSWRFVLRDGHNRYHVIRERATNCVGYMPGKYMRTDWIYACRWSWWASFQVYMVLKIQRAIRVYPPKQYRPEFAYLEQPERSEKYV